MFFEYELIQSGIVKIEIFDLVGHQVLEIKNETQAPGSYTIPVTLNEKGLFFLRMNVNGAVKTFKLVNN